VQGYVTFLENKEVNNGTGFIEGGVFGVGQPAPSRMEAFLLVIYGYKTDGIFKIKLKLMHIHHK
jgi:hypothetical protein